LEENGLAIDTSAVGRTGKGTHDRRCPARDFPKGNRFTNDQKKPIGEKYCNISIDEIIAKMYKK
jgi:hypothetical protein